MAWGSSLIIGAGKISLLNYHLENAYQTYLVSSSIVCGNLLIYPYQDCLILIGNWALVPPAAVLVASTSESMWLEGKTLNTNILVRAFVTGLPTQADVLINGSIGTSPYTPKFVHPKPTSYRTQIRRSLWDGKGMSSDYLCTVSERV